MCVVIICIFVFDNIVVVAYVVCNVLAVVDVVEVVIIGCGYDVVVLLLLLVLMLVVGVVVVVVCCCYC